LPSHGATDAARAATDIVLTEEGLSVIIDAIFESRKIFQRMRNYIIYRIACTLQLLCFFFLGMCASVDVLWRISHCLNAPLVVMLQPLVAVSPDGPTMYNYDSGQKVRCRLLTHIASTFFIGAFLVQTDPFVSDPTELAHAPSFTLPIIALVIITILNDGCMITIAYDRNGAYFT